MILKAILVGLEGPLLMTIRHELSAYGADIYAEVDNLAALVDMRKTMPNDLRIVITDLKSDPEIRQLKNYGAIFAGWPILALIDPLGDPGRLLAAQRAGASQVVMLPLQPEDLREALDAIAVQVSHVEHDPQVIAIAGVTGGVGATTLTINLANELGHLFGLRTIVVELSLKMGVLGVYLNQEPEYTIHYLFENIGRLDSELVKMVLTSVNDRLSVLVGPHAAVNPISIHFGDVVQVVNAALELCDVVILDVPATYDDLYFDTLSSAGMAVLVGQQKIPSIRAMKLVSETLERERSVGKIFQVINRYDSRVSGFTLKDLRSYLKSEDLLSVSEDPGAVDLAVNTGKLLRKVAVHSRALADIDSLAQVLMPNARTVRPASSSGRNLLGRIFRGLNLA